MKKRRKRNRERMLLLLLMILLVVFGALNLTKDMRNTNNEENQVDNESLVSKEEPEKKGSFGETIGKTFEKVKKTMSGKPGQGMIITCWGDSLTWGAKGEGVNYPEIIEKLSGAEVHNYGVGGESSLAIAARQGGLPMQVNNITIPSSGTVQIGTLENSGIYSITGTMLTPLLQGGDSSVNLCTIAGVEGHLEWTGAAPDDVNGIYRFTRITDGEEVVITTPTTIVTSAMLDRTEDILVIFIGENGGWNSNQELISQIQAMIDYSVCDGKYVVCGITSQSAGERAGLEADMAAAFGDKYLNLREYLVTEGLADAGMTPTEQDLAHMEVGSLPGSLRSDLVHGNAVYYELVGEKIFEKITELGYFEANKRGL